jgi:SP family general alpha glucoside:H+ symporter-like MFS transporter
MPIVHELKEYATEHEDVGTSSSHDYGADIDTSDDIFAKMSAAVPDLVSLTADAAAATAAEHKMTLREGLKLYPKAIGWSMALSLAIVMEGYDTILLASFYALPEFKKHYGDKTPSGGYEISPAWQAGLSNGAQVGEIIGLFVNGIIAERYGYRLTMIWSLVAVTCFIFLAFFAVNIEMLEVAEILCGESPPSFFRGACLLLPLLHC